MNALQKFEYNGAAVRTQLDENGEIWFVAKDVCDVLNLEQVSRVMDRLDEDERGLIKVTHPQSPAKLLETNAVNEAGLYSLILTSNKPEAKSFKRWVTHEVLPSIRKTGRYLTDSAEADVSAALKLIAAKFENYDKRLEVLEAPKKFLPKQLAERDQFVEKVHDKKLRLLSTFLDTYTRKNLETSVSKGAIEKQYREWLSANNQAGFKVTKYEFLCGCRDRYGFYTNVWSSKVYVGVELLPLQSNGGAA